MAKKVTIAELSIDTDAFLAKSNALHKEIEKLKQQQKELRKNGQASSAQFNDNAVALKKLSAQYNEQKNVLTALSTTTGRYNSVEEQLEQTLNTNAKSIQDVRNQNKELLKIRNQLDLSTESGLNALDAVNKKLDENNQFIKDNVSAYEQQKINIGNYKSALEGLNPMMGNMFTVLTQIKQGLIDYSIAMKATQAGTTGTSKALKVFRVALISTGIGAILVALGSLITFLSTTQKGIDKVSSVLRPLKAVFDTFVGVIQKVGEALFDAFSKPQETVKALWNAIKTNVVNRVTGLMDTFKAVGKVIQSAFTLDFTSMKEGLKEVGESIAQTITGVDDLPNKLANGFKQLGEGIDEAWKKGQRIHELQVAIENEEIRIAEQRAKSMAIIKEQNKIAEDVTKTLAEREEGARKAIEESEKLLAIEQGILDMKIEQMEIEQTLNDTTREDELELAELKGERHAKDAEALEMQTTLTNKLNIIRQSQASKVSKAVDEQLKKQQTLLNIFIAEQGVKAKSFEEEVRFAEQVRDKKISLLNEQLAHKKITEEEFKLAEIQANTELNQTLTDLTVEQAERELEIFRNSMQTKLDTNTFFTDEMLLQEQERLDAIAEKEREFHEKRLEQGVINQQEYNDAINAVNEENRLAQEELQLQRDEAQKEKELLDLENKRLIDEENFMSGFEIQMSRLDAQRKAEVANAEKTGADVELINKKYDLRQQQLSALTAQAKIDANAQAFGAIASFLGEETRIGKLASVAQASINIQQGITKAMASKGFAGIAEGVIIATKGAMAIGKILGVNDSFYEGGKVPELSSGRITASQNIPTQRGGDNVLATVKRGEVILNKEQQQRAGGDAFFRSIGVPNFNTGGLVGTPSTIGTPSKGIGIDMDKFAEVLSNKINDVKIVAIEDDITSAQGLQTDIIEGARI